ncbi:MAG: uroporphyrinogen-III C-methyltransferase [Fibrobacteraceae bacterium]|nr:uroporphyrinogen-III C-methyltransferase [Fibrobacteraceae bacterium]
MAGKVYLIGAGPGDSGLLTLRGREILEKAHVVVYDRLVSTGVLSFCNVNAQMVDVGKMPTHHKVKQSEINKLLVKFAQEYPHGVVVRLKGGDPFVFGRGGEEALELTAAGIDFEVVPGVTAGIAVPAYAGIPVTHRGVASSLHIITGHEKGFIEGHADENLGLDFETLAKCPGTLVFYMGISNMAFIASKLIEFGKNGKTPLAFIEKGTTPFERTVYASLETAANVIEKENVTAPAITIMGEVVEFGEKLSWRKKRPLSGKRLVVTRSAKQASGISARLSALGAEVIETPMIETRAVIGELDFALLKNTDVLAFTSANGVNHFFEKLLESGKDIRLLAGKKIASVGKITEKKLASYGILCDYVPEDHTGEGLGKMLQSVCQGSKILTVQGNLADDTLVQILKDGGVEAQRMVVYETLQATEMPDWKIHAVECADGVVFASSSAVTAFVDVLGVSGISGATDGLWTLQNRPLAFCIGRLTQATAEKNGFKTVTSDETTMDSLVKKIVDFYIGG